MLSFSEDRRAAQMSEYEYHNADPTYANAYLWPALRAVIESRDWTDRRAFDLGCGNGATCGLLSDMGFTVTAIDTSESGIAQARSAYPRVHAHIGSAYDDLASTYGTLSALRSSSTASIRAPSLTGS